MRFHSVASSVLEHATLRLVGVSCPPVESNCACSAEAWSLWQRGGVNSLDLLNGGQPKRSSNVYLGTNLRGVSPEGETS
jgi:hypothetical protein